MIAILQPHIPHYREEFFLGIQNRFDFDLFCYQDDKIVKANNFNDAANKTIGIRSRGMFGFLLYNPFVFRQYDTLILMLHFGHITTWFLLLTKRFHKKKIILWGHGISVKRYLKEEKHPSILLKIMIGLSDGIWVYTEKEKQIWKKIFPEKNIISLNNTISNIDKILEAVIKDKKGLKTKYKIKQEIILIFCARFNEPGRRVDLLIDVIKQLDSCKFGFIIIGEGNEKPNFSTYSNVYDFGSVYDQSIKNDLFNISDIYFQPGWLGLSIVEAMAYGKPIFSFARSKKIHQCVEYYYVKDGFNGRLFRGIEECLFCISNISNGELIMLGSNAKKYIRENHSMANMITSATSIL